MDRSYGQLNPHALVGAARVAIENTLADPEILALVAPAGYDEPELTKALERVQALAEAALGKEDRYGIQVGRTAALDTARERFHEDVYVPHVEIARRLFRNEPGARARLGLNGEREKAFHPWLGQARQFYANALAAPALSAPLATRGLTADVLQDALDALDALALTDQQQEDDKGLAQQATRDRKTIQKEVAAWLGEFRENATFRLRTHPEWLERLGFRHRTEAPPEIG